MINNGNSIFDTIKSLSKKFWILNLIQMIERMAYWITILQIPIYISQKDAVGGLHWDQTAKGVLFFCWALVQNLTPVFMGGFADRYGKKKLIMLSYCFYIIGLLLFATQRSEFAIYLAAILLGFGIGALKPALLGSIALATNEENSGVGWGIYVTLVNIAVFIGSPLAIYFKLINWSTVFYGSAAIISIDAIITFFIKDEPELAQRTESPFSILKRTFKYILRPKIGFFVLCMSGFTMIYMQFYETLPNFIVDWVDTSNVATVLSLPKFMLANHGIGNVIAYEWLYNLNAITVLLFAVLVSWFLSGKDTLIGVIIGVTLAALGLFICGFDQSGWLLILGIIIYSFGELISNPGYNNFMSQIAPTKDKSLFMGIMSISWTFGLAGGGLLGGWMYKHFGEKSGFAAKYLEANHNLTNIEPTAAFSKLVEVTGLTPEMATTLLWRYYTPFTLWTPFLFIGLFSVVGLIFYYRRFKIYQ